MTTARDGVGDRRSERGSASVEFAVVMPAVVAVLVLGLSGMQLATHQLQLADAAADAARAAGRGEAPGTALAGRNLGEASVTRQDRGELVCTRLSSVTPVLGLRVPITAEACALDGGR